VTITLGIVTLTFLIQANSITFFCDQASRTFCKAKFASSIVVIKFLDILTR